MVTMKLINIEHILLSVAWNRLKQFFLMHSGPIHQNTLVFRYSWLLLFFVSSFWKTIEATTATKEVSLVICIRITTTEVARKSLLIFNCTTKELEELFRKYNKTTALAFILYFDWFFRILNLPKWVTEKSKKKKDKEWKIGLWRETLSSKKRASFSVSLNKR